MATVPQLALPSVSRSAAVNDRSIDRCRRGVGLVIAVRLAPARRLDPGSTRLRRQALLAGRASGPRWRPLPGTRRRSLQQRHQALTCGFAIGGLGPMFTAVDDQYAIGRDTVRNECREALLDRV